MHVASIDFRSEEPALLATTPDSGA
jgi:hypothetical protein